MEWFYLSFNVSFDVAVLLLLSELIINTDIYFM